MTVPLDRVSRRKTFIDCSQILCSSFSFRFSMVIQLLAYQRATELKEWKLSVWVVDNPEILDEIAMFSCSVQHVDLLLEILAGYGFAMMSTGNVHGYVFNKHQLCQLTFLLVPSSFNVFSAYVFPPSSTTLYAKPNLPYYFN